MTTTIKYSVFGCFISILMLPCLVFARAGDGHGGYESSSSESYSPSYSDSSSSSSPSTSTAGAGSFGALVVMVVVFVVPLFLAYRFSPAIRKEINQIFTPYPKIGSTPIPPPHYRSLDTPSSNLAEQKTKLQVLDPLWNEQKFKELVHIGFFKIQQAWSDGDMSSARAYISDTILQRFSLQLSPYLAKNQKNILGQLSLDSVDILNITIDESHTHIEVLVRATCTDTIVDISSGAVIANNYNGKLSTWREKWVWTRSNSVKTQATESGVFAAHCPSCGAPLNINAVGKCEYCNTTLTTGEFDWVLSEIVQIS